MFDNKITAKIASLLPNLPIILGENSLRHDIDDLVASVLPKMRVCVVDDLRTSEAFGDDIFRAVMGEHVTLQGFLDATNEEVKYIRERSKKCDALIAVGGGVVGDLCKYVSHLDGKPYIVFPTAASMNGYLSANASISFSGHKTTVPAQLPLAVFCDFGVIASAPPRLSKAGLGDSLARPTAQADWLLSHLLLQTPYNAEVFELLVEAEGEVFANAEGIAAVDPQTIKKLLELLLLSGLGMTICGGSYPASQGEHMIAHTYNMMTPHLDEILPNLHGEEIAITTLYMAELQEKLIRRMGSRQCEEALADAAIHTKDWIASPQKDSVACNDRNNYFPTDELKTLFGEKLTAEFQAEFEKKLIVMRHCEEQSDEAIQNNNKDWIASPQAARNDNTWQSIAEKIEKIAIPSQKIETILRKAKAPTLPKDIGWSDDDFQNACKFARFTRDRFTFLDFS